MSRPDLTTCWLRAPRVEWKTNQPADQWLSPQSELARYGTLCGELSVQGTERRSSLVDCEGCRLLLALGAEMVEGV